MPSPSLHTMCGLYIGATHIKCVLLELGVTIGLVTPSSKSTHFICVAPIYKPHIVCSDGDGMHGSISPDAINFTIKYMMGGG